MRRIILLYAFVSWCTFIMAQKKQKTEAISGFGIRFKPIVNSVPILNVPKQTMTSGLTNFSFERGFSYNLGALVRLPLYKKSLFQVGINAVIHSYKHQISQTRTQQSFNFNTSLVTFEVPFQLGYEIKLGQYIKMSGLAGISADVFLKESNRIEDNYSWYLAKNNFITPALIFDLGWYYTSYKSGGFYLGFSLHNSLGNLVRSFMTYEDVSGKKDEVFFDVTDNYLSLDFIYFLP